MCMWCCVLFTRCNSFVICASWLKKTEMLLLLRLGGVRRYYVLHPPHYYLLFNCFWQNRPKSSLLHADLIKGWISNCSAEALFYGLISKDLSLKSTTTTTNNNKRWNKYTHRVVPSTHRSTEWVQQPQHTAGTYLAKKWRNCELHRSGCSNCGGPCMVINNNARKGGSRIRGGSLQQRTKK